MVSGSSYEPNEKDVELVMSQVNATRERSVYALHKHCGDIVEAILELVDVASPTPMPTVHVVVPSAPSYIDRNSHNSSEERRMTRMYINHTVKESRNALRAAMSSTGDVVELEKRQHKVLKQVWALYRMVSSMRTQDIESTLIELTDYVCTHSVEYDAVYCKNSPLKLYSVLAEMCKPDTKHRTALNSLMSKYPGMWAHHLQTDADGTASIVLDEEDVKLVMRCGPMTRERAVAALRRHGGCIGDALVLGEKWVDETD